MYGIAIEQAYNKISITRIKIILKEGYVIYMYHMYIFVNTWVKGEAMDKC